MSFNGVDLNNLEKALQLVDISLYDKNENIKCVVCILSEMSEIWDELSEDRNLECYIRRMILGK